MSDSDCLDVLYLKRIFFSLQNSKIYLASQGRFLKGRKVGVVKGGFVARPHSVIKVKGEQQAR